MLWVGEGRGVAGQPGVIKSESLGSGWGICSYGPDAQPWAWDLEELMCPIPGLVGAQPSLSRFRRKRRMTVSCIVKGSSFGGSRSLGSHLAP